MSQKFTLWPDANRANVLANAQAFLAKLPASVAWQIEVKRKTKTRSDQQNRYLWGVCYAALAQATGQEAEDWHEFFLGEFFGWQEHEMFGKRKLKPQRRSSKLSVQEFADYVAYIQMRAAENGVFIPDPDAMHGSET